MVTGRLAAHIALAAPERPLNSMIMHWPAAHIPWAAKVYEFKDQAQACLAHCFACNKILYEFADHVKLACHMAWLGRDVITF